MRKLNIGGEKRKEGWEIFNLKPYPGVDYIGHADNMSRFKDETFGEVYASHILEHFRPAMANQALKEWNRILKPNGTLYISIPDLDVLCRMLLDKSLKNEHRLYLLAVLYGSQKDEFGVHRYGYNWDILSTNLFMAGFSKGNKVDNFGIFDDLSNMVYLGRKISLNVIATKR